MLRSTRGDIHQSKTICRLWLIFAAVVCLLSFAPASSAQVNAQPGAVVLVARIQDQVGVQWGSVPVTGLLRQYEFLPEGDVSHTAHLFVFQNNVHVGMGQVIQGESLLEAAEGRAEMLAIDSTATGAASSMWSLLPNAPARSSRWQGPDPRKGSQQVMQSCLVVAEEGEAPLLRVRLTAL